MRKLVTRRSDMHPITRLIYYLLLGWFWVTFLLGVVVEIHYLKDVLFGG